MKNFFYFPLLFFVLNNFSFASSKELHFINSRKEVKNLINNKQKDVFIYFDYSCPVCMTYRQKIEDIIVRSGDSLNIYIIFTSMTDTMEVFEYEDFKNGSSTFYYDSNNLLSKKLKVNIVPTVVIYQDRKKIYLGKIDDRFNSIIDDKMNITKDYVEDILFLNKKHDDNLPLGCKFR